MNYFKALLCVFLLLSIAGFAQSAAHGPQSTLEFYGKLPIVFEPNQGQMPDSAAFVAHEPGMAVLFERGGMQFLTSKGAQPIHVAFQSAAYGAIAGEKPLAGRTNYLIGNDSRRWHTDIPNYQAIRYGSLYPGIDLSFYGNGRHLEHDFTVAPGADPRRIEMVFAGPGALKKGRHGEAVFIRGAESLLFERPVAYQETAAGRRRIAAKFVVRENRLSFRVGDYDRSLPLVIDPVLVYSTYVTGPKGASASRIAIDSAGNAYLTGLAFATDFPITASAVQPACKSCASNLPDIFVAKLNSTGTALVYATYLGGSDYDEPFSLAVDGNGNAIIGGRTESSDFPTSPLETPTFNFSSFHGFIASLSADGTALNWSHYSGGTNGSTEIVWAVAVDGNNNAYAAGVTDNPDFPTTPGTIAHDPVSFQVNDIFAIKYDSTGAKQYSAVLGHNGSPSDAFANRFDIGGIAADSQGEAVIAGSASNGLPTTAGSFQPASHATPNSQSQNAFVVKLAADASALVFGTYLGGSGSDTGKAVALDPGGNIYIAGSAGAGDFPTTPGAFQTKFTNFLNCCGAFAAKLDPTGAHLLYSTFLGGTASSNGFTEGHSIAVDGATGNAYVGGDTSDLTFPLVHPVKDFLPNSFNKRAGFVAELNPAASSLLFSTVFSGSTGTNNNSLALDGNNAVYIGGTSSDTDLPTTPGAFETSIAAPPPNTGVLAPYVAKIDPTVAAPTVCQSTAFLAFPGTRVGSPSSPVPVTLTNCGNADLIVASATFAPGAFQVQSNGCAAPVIAGGSCVISMVFTPTQLGLTTSTLTIQDNASVGTQKVAVSGNGVLPQINFSPSVGFDPALVGTTLSNRVLLISNTGVITANISSVTLNGAEFAITSDNCVGALLPNRSCQIGLSFTPGDIGTRTGSIVLADDAAGNPQTVQLTGTGVASYPVPTITGITPISVQAGAAPFTLTVTGTNFFQASVIRVNGVDHATRYLSGTGLSATVNSTEIASLGEESITVFNPAPGGGESNAFKLTTFMSIPLSALNMAYDPFTRKIYALLSSVSGPADSIAVIDPFNLQVGAPIALGGHGARQMALSDDSQFLYAGFDADHTLGRLNLYTHQTGPSSLLGADSITGANLRAFDIEPVPGDPHTVVATVFRPASPGEAGVDLIRDGVLLSRLPDDFPLFVEADSLGFTSSPATVYGAGFNNGTFYQFGIANNALSVTSSSTLIPAGDALGSFVSDGAKLYTSSGRIVDPASAAIVAEFPTFITFTNFASTVIPATDIGRIFFMDLSGEVAVFDTNTLQEVGRIGFPHTNFASKMARWGRDGLALLFGDVNNPLPTDSLLLFRTSLALPPPATGAASISGISPGSSAATGQNFVLTVNGSGFAPGSVVLWNGAERTTKFGSGSQLTADIPGTDIQGAGTAQVAVLNPGIGTSAAAGFTITAGSAPFVQLSALSVDFGSLASGGSSGQQTIIVTNAGNATLHLLSNGITGDFRIVTPCGTTLAPGASCPVQVIFAPTAAGPRSGVLAFTDDAIGSPHQVALRGTATDFSVGPVGGGSRTVQSGQSAVYNLSLVGASGFSGQVTLSCSGLPAASSCAFNPASLTVGSAAVPFTLTIATTARSSAGIVPTENTSLPASWIPVLSMSCLSLLAMLWLSLHAAKAARLRRMAWASLAAGFLLAGIAGCGGGGGGGPQQGPPPVVGTPAGTYNVTVAATGNGGATRQTQLTLVVQ